MGLYLTDSETYEITNGAYVPGVHYFKLGSVKCVPMKRSLLRRFRRHNC